MQMYGSTWSYRILLHDLKWSPNLPKKLSTGFKMILAKSSSHCEETASFTWGSRGGRPSETIFSTMAGVRNPVDKGTHEASMRRMKAVANLQF